VQVNLAPKTPNWDLKRDVAPKLEKLQRATMQAIHDILSAQRRAPLAAYHAI
jgi:coiled-coil domain-containing protein 12